MDKTQMLEKILELFSQLPDKEDEMPVETEVVAIEAMPKDEEAL
jgi:hypothetical protein